MSEWTIEIATKHEGGGDGTVDAMRDHLEAAGVLGVRLSLDMPSRSIHATYRVEADHYLEAIHLAIAPFMAAQRAAGSSHLGIHKLVITADDAPTA
jgi:hypothetical protein